MTRLEKVLAIIPAFNEEANIEMVVDELAALCPETDYLVVNDAFHIQNRRTVYIRFLVLLKSKIMFSWIHGKLKFFIFAVFQCTL